MCNEIHINYTYLLLLETNGTIGPGITQGSVLGPILLAQCTRQTNTVCTPFFKYLIPIYFSIQNCLLQMSSSEDFVTKSPEKTPTHKTKRDPLKWLEDKEKEDKDKYREKDRYKEKDRYTTESRYTDKRKEDDRLRTEEREKATKADSDKLAKEKSDKEEEKKKYRKLKN